MRAGWTIAIRCSSDVQFAFGVSLAWLVLYNVSFWEQTIRAMWSPSPLMPTRLIMRCCRCAAATPC